MQKENNRPLPSAVSKKNILIQQIDAQPSTVVDALEEMNISPTTTPDTRLAFLVGDNIIVGDLGDYVAEYKDAISLTESNVSFGLGLAFPAKAAKDYIDEEIRPSSDYRVLDDASYIILKDVSLISHSTSNKSYVPEMMLFTDNISGVYYVTEAQYPRKPS